MDISSWNWNAIKDCSFNGLAITFCGVVLYSLLRKGTPETARLKTYVPKTTVTVAAILAVVFAVLGNPDRIESLSFSPINGFAAKTRELNKTIDDAKEAIRQIRELAVVSAETLIDLSENSNALLVEGPGQDEYKKQDERKAKILESLRKMGLPMEQVAAVTQWDKNVVMSFYANAAYRFGRDALPQSKWNDIDNAYNTLAAKQPLTPDQCQAFLDSFQIDTTKFADYRDDFRYYIKTGEQRRPEVWARRGSWGFGNLPQQ